MIDDDDAWIFLLFTRPYGAISFVLVLVVFVALKVIAHENKTECESQKCAAGMKAQLMSHRCVCVGTPEAK